MMEVLLTSEAFIKDVTSISDNIAGKYILPSIREAQHTGLRSILGTALYEKLIELVADDSIDGNPEYKELLDSAQYYLAYKTVADLTWRVSFKVANMGVVRTTDERVDGVSIADVEKNATFYQSKADSYAADLQRYLLEHRDDYPELTDNKCYELRANLRSSASCGVWLGSARGKRMPR